MPSVFLVKYIILKRFYLFTKIDRIPVKIYPIYSFIVYGYFTQHETIKLKKKLYMYIPLYQTSLKQMYRYLYGRTKFN